MEHILIIANEFPPTGGSGVQRSANFVSHLTELGYAPIVITKKYSRGLKDDSLMSKLPQNLVRYDLPAYDFMNRSGFLGKIIRFLATRFLIPDGEVFWYLKHRKKVLKILDERNIAKVYTTSYPYSDHLMGKFLKAKRPYIQWLADFRDEWTNNPYFTEKWHMRLRYRIEKKMELTIVDACNYLITNTPFMLKNFLEDSPFKKDVSCFVPNGYDPTDFKDYKIKNDTNKRFTMTYMGALYGKRRPDYVLKALQALIVEKKIRSDEVELSFIGNYHECIMDDLKQVYQLQDVMTVTGYMAHSVLLKHMAQSNLLLLIESEKNFYTGKVFEYIVMGIPILATVPKDGAAASVVNQTQTGDVVGFSDIDAIKAALLKRFKAWQGGTVDYKPDKIAIEKYSWKSHAKTIVSCFKEK